MENEYSRKTWVRMIFIFEELNKKKGMKRFLIDLGALCMQRETKNPPAKVHTFHEGKHDE